MPVKLVRRGTPTPRYTIDPELSQRRLRTLVALLDKYVATDAIGSKYLSSKEAREWARQCRALLK